MRCFAALSECIELLSGRRQIFVIHKKWKIELFLCLGLSWPASEEVRTGCQLWSSHRNRSQLSQFSWASRPMFWFPLTVFCCCFVDLWKNHDKTIFNVTGEVCRHVRDVLLDDVFDQAASVFLYEFLEALRVASEVIKSEESAAITNVLKHLSNRMKLNDSIVYEKTWPEPDPEPIEFEKNTTSTGTRTEKRQNNRTGTQALVLTGEKFKVRFH